MLSICYEPKRYRPSRNTVVLSSYPRSGATVFRFLVSALMHRQETIDYDTIKELFPDIYEGKPKASSPIIKSHQPPLYKNRMIVLVRNPQDVYESYYHYKVKRHNFKNGCLTFNEFISLARENALDRYETLLFHLEIIESLVEEDAVLVIDYNSLVNSKEKVIEKVSNFLDIELLKDDFIRANNITSKVRMRRLAEDRVEHIGKSFVRKHKEKIDWTDLDFENGEFIKKCIIVYERITAKLFS